MADFEDIYGNKYDLVSDDPCNKCALKSDCSAILTCDATKEESTATHICENSEDTYFKKVEE